VPVYLDHAATTAVYPHVAEAMAQQQRLVGNPSSLHTAGRAARRVIEESRERLAGALGARPSEVIFTSGGTESDNLSIAGIFRARRDADPRRSRIVVSAVEHHAVLDCVEALAARDGATVTWVPCEATGEVTASAVREAIELDPASVALVTVMWANNEVGAVNDVPAIAEVTQAHGIPLHVDAVQAVGHLPVDMSTCGADAVSISAHKVGGPVGAGALLLRRDREVVPLVYGGGQERQVRSGTLDTVGALGMSLAVEYAVTHLAREADRLAALRDSTIEGAMALDRGITAGGVWKPSDVTHRLPGNAHLLVPGCDGDSLLYLLDAAGVEVSTGSACQAGVPQPSHVLLAMGLAERAARGALRVTFGHTSVASDVDAFLAALPAAVDRARRAAGTT
jgi:cysteine desulfurase